MRMRRLLARLVLLWEALWAALWPAASVAGGFVGLALTGWLLHLPGWAHAAVLVLFAAAFLGLLGRGLGRLRLPGRADAWRRLERDNALPHRPLSDAGEGLDAGGGDPVARRLWQAHARRRDALRAAVRRVAPPAPGVAARDPRGLRPLALLALVIGVAAGHEAPGARLAAALRPAVSLGGPPARVEVWVKPPPYTGRPPVHRERQAHGERGDPITVPEGSTVLALVHGADSAPVLGNGDSRRRFRRLGPRTFRFEGPLDGGDRLAVRLRGHPAAVWPLTVTADAPPEVALAGPPRVTRDGTLKLRYRARDDYGLASVAAVIRRPGAEGRGVVDGPLVLDLPAGTTDEAATVRTSTHALADHPWAGLEVTLHLKATDDAGHTVTGGRHPLTLPRRDFDHPVARAVAKARRELVRRPHANREPVMGALDRLSARPGRFDGDTAAFLGLRSARWQLAHGDGLPAVRGALDLLWRVALAIETDNAALARRDLRQAREALRKALNTGADAATLERRSQALRRALERYLAALEKKLGGRAATGMAARDARTVTPDDLRRMAKRLEALSATGARDAARRLLERMRSLTANMRTGPVGPRAQKAGHLMDKLRDLAARQRGLLDQGAGAPPGALKQQAGDQGRLRQQLEGLRQGLQGLTGRAPDALDKAGGAMGDAAGALRRGKRQPAARAQQKALTALKQSATQARRALARALGRTAPGARGARGTAGAPTAGGVELPAEGGVKRSRRILETLRQRAGDPERPEDARDYFRRLLEPF